MQIIQRRDLAGGMAHQGQRQFILGDAPTVVAYTQELDTAALQLYRDVRRTCVEAILQQFLQGCSRTLDHFAGGDLVDEEIG